MSDPIDALLAYSAERVGRRLSEVIRARGAWPSGLREVMDYPIGTGGKRMRPAFCYAAAAAVSGESEIPSPGAAPPIAWLRAEPAGLAVELIHTYSLVHDDLPSMDDDDQRRGRPTVHKAYDVARAILAGDALLTLAFGVAGGDGELYPAEVPAELRLSAVIHLARAAGAAGMVGGQSMDLGHEGPNDDLDALEVLHRAKTGALFRFACRAGAELAGGPPEQVAAIESLGEDLGLAFQIADDVLDVEQDGAVPGVDDEEPSYVTHLGMDGARKRAREVVDAALDRLAPMGEHAALLRGLALRTVERVY